MAVNQVFYGNTPLIDLTNVDAEAEDVSIGKRFMNRSGELTAGTALYTVIYDVTLTDKGAIDTVDPDLTYQAVKTVLDGGVKKVLLKVSFEDSVFYVPALQEMDETNGPIKFIGGYIGKDDQLRIIECTLTTANVLSSFHYQVESWMYKVQDIVANASNTLTYPTTKAVYDQFQRKPAVVWRAANDSEMLKGIQAAISADPAWQLTGLDMTPYKRIKVHAKCGQGSGAAAASGTTAAMVLEMSLDPFAAISEYGGNYCGSIITQKPNNDNRLATLTCAVSADKTKFVVLRQTNLYGTAATNNNDVNADVFLIEGYYD